MPRKCVCYWNAVEPFNGISDGLNERTFKQSYSEMKHMLVCLAEQGLTIMGYHKAGPRSGRQQYFQFKAGSACITVLLLGISITESQPSLTMTEGTVLLSILVARRWYKTTTLNTTRNRGNARDPQTHIFFCSIITFHDFFSGTWLMNMVRSAQTSVHRRPDGLLLLLPTPLIGIPVCKEITRVILCPKEEQEK